MNLPEDINRNDRSNSFPKEFRLSRAGAERREKKKPRRHPSFRFLILRPIMEKIIHLDSMFSINLRENWNDDDEGIYSFSNPVPQPTGSNKKISNRQNGLGRKRSCRDIFVHARAILFISWNSIAPLCKLGSIVCLKNSTTNYFGLSFGLGIKANQTQGQSSIRLSMVSQRRGSSLDKAKWIVRPSLSC